MMQPYPALLQADMQIQCVNGQERKGKGTNGTRPSARAMEFLDREFAQEARDEALMAASEARPCIAVVAAA